jgi:hypothetical protein
MSLTERIAKSSLLAQGALHFLHSLFSLRSCLPRFPFLCCADLSPFLGDGMKWNSSTLTLIPVRFLLRVFERRSTVPVRCCPTLAPSLELEMRFDS